MFCLTNVYSKCSDMKCSPCHAQVAICLLPWSLVTTANEWVIDFRPAQNAASLIPWSHLGLGRSWRSKHYQAMPLLRFVRLQSLLVSLKPSIRYCRPVSLNKLWKSSEIRYVTMFIKEAYERSNFGTMSFMSDVHWRIKMRISWQF